MKTICAQSVLYGRNAFETIGAVEVVPDDEIDNAGIKDADALIIRSKTAVDEGLLNGTSVKFVGTATAGYDHIDTEALGRIGVHWSAAPGCNATSVAEYIVAALLETAAGNGRPLERQRIAVIGVGEVGRRVAARARGLGMSVLLNDPPRAVREPHNHFYELAEALPQADIVTIHTPLTDSVPYPTRKLVDYDFISRLKPECTFINAARGEIVNERALMDAIDSGIIRHTILDVWCDEPYCNPDLLELVDIGTPHIAGYSYDGKLRGTAMIYAKACEYFGRAPCWNEAEFLPAPPLEEGILSQMEEGDESLLLELVRQIYSIRDDNRAMRPEDKLDREKHARLFKRLRREYPIRREFAGTHIHVDPPNIGLTNKVRALGFGML